MNTVLKMIAAALFVAAIGSVAHAQGKQDFTLVNKTGYPIEKVYISAANTSDWEEDVMGQSILDNGASINMTFSGSKACKWDMKVVYDDGEEAIWNGFDLCQISKITIKWNKTTGETTALTE
ncbi:MAG: hypothetical protein GC191_07940 [Azospirillum sp.]|nr:hypothetical protein [Azospirillum sp.]